MKSTVNNNNDPLEVSLVFEVKKCRTCKFFWPEKGPQTYGPYPTYDFEQNFPKENKPTLPHEFSYPWVNGVTQKEGFPEPEVVDGCRKAPIMTIGINPNLTAFLPGPTGASWVYPVFNDTKNTNAYTKYAWYYRYRSVYQEHLDTKFIQSQLLKQGQVKASADGEIVAANAPSEAPLIDLKTKSTSGKTQDHPLKWKPGTPRYVVLQDTHGSGAHFKKGELLAAKLNVAAGKKVNIDREIIGYYEQFVPVLNDFNKYLQSKGHKAANLQIGEDVCQLDMVACASPHWGPPFLGGTTKSENTIVHNCVSNNAWAVKQLIQTNPAVLYIVGEASYDMFYKAFHKWIKSKKPFPKNPVDGAFTLLRLTTDAKNPYYIEFSYKEGGHTYHMKTRLVISPHFSYNSNFVPQFRLSPSDLAAFKKKYAKCYYFLMHNTDIVCTLPEEKDGYTAFSLIKDPKAVFDQLQKHYAAALVVLNKGYYAAHTMLYSVMEDLFTNGGLTWTSDKNGGYISRNQGACHFCVNKHWEFPLGCPYGKIHETPPPAGFLEAAAQAFVKGGN